MDQPTAYLWHFPPEDFEAWRTVENPGAECRDYADYLAMLALSQLALEAEGHRVVRVRLTFDEMQTHLAALNIPNMPGWHDTILKLVAAERGEGRS